MSRFFYFYLVLIENYSSLKEELIAKGFHFNSDTDTEVLVNLIEYIQIKEKIKKRLGR